VFSAESPLAAEWRETMAMVRFLGVRRGPG